MKKILDLITEELVKAFEEAGYDAKFAKAALSNRPDLCEYQCNGAMAVAKIYKKAPIMIANDVVEKLKGNPVFSMADAVNPGFINLNLDEAFLGGYLRKMQADPDLSVEKVKEPKKIIIDYGGPNVAKPLHVGHLRSAIIGESIKRMGRFMGHEVIGDVHLGDWGLQMGLIITEHRNWSTLMSLIPENTRKKHHLPLVSWKKFIRQPVLTQRPMKITKKKLCRPPICCSMATEDIRQF